MSRTALATAAAKTRIISCGEIIVKVCLSSRVRYLEEGELDEANSVEFVLFILSYLSVYSVTLSQEEGVEPPRVIESIFHVSCLSSSFDISG